MTNPQPNVGGVPPAAAAEAARAITGEPDRDEPTTTDDGVPVGAADAEEDRKRAMGDDDRE